MNVQKKVTNHDNKEQNRLKSNKDSKLNFCGAFINTLRLPEFIIYMDSLFHNLLAINGKDSVLK